MTHCADAARRPDEQRIVGVASILAAGILRLLKKIIWRLQSQAEGDPSERARAF